MDDNDNFKSNIDKIIVDHNKEQPVNEIIKNYDRNQLLKIKLAETIVKLEKSYEKKINNAVLKERDRVIKKIFEMYPHFESEKNHIIKECSRKYEVVMVNEYRS